MAPCCRGLPVPATLFFPGELLLARPQIHVLRYSAAAHSQENGLYDSSAWLLQVPTPACAQTLILGLGATAASYWRVEGNQLNISDQFSCVSL